MSPSNVAWSAPLTIATVSAEEDRNKTRAVWGIPYGPRRGAGDGLLSRDLSVGVPSAL